MEAVEFRPLFVHRVDSTIESVKAVVARHAGGENAVEHIDSAGNGVDDVFGVPNAHKVAGFVFGKERCRMLNHGILHLCGLADGDSADGDSVEGEIGDIAGTFVAHIEVDSALNDSEDGLTFFPHGKVSMRPFMGAFHRLVGFVARAGVRRALVEHHADIDT